MPILPFDQTGEKLGIIRSLRADNLGDVQPFTGSDCKVLIIPDGDSVNTDIITQYLTEIAQSLNTTPNDALTGNFQLLNFPGTSIPLPNPIIYAQGEGVTGYDSPAEGAVNEPEAFGLIVGLQTITISSYRSKMQVRTIGSVNPRGIARGSRTVAGTLVITEFDRSPFWKILVPPQLDSNILDAGPVLADQMRPFDIILLFVNELGNAAMRQIYGAEIVTDGSVYSIQDMYTENTLSYLARDVSPLIPLTQYGPMMLKFSNFIYHTRKDIAGEAVRRLKASRSPFL